MALTPEQVESLRACTEEIAQPVIEWLLTDIVERVSEAGKMTSTAAYETYRAQALGASKQDLKKFLKKQLGISNQEIRQLFRSAARIARDSDYERIGVWATEAQQETLEQITKAAIQLATKDFKNLTQTMGMVSPLTGKAEPLQDVYRECMDQALKLVSTGATSASQAARMATRALASRGIVSIDYESGVFSELGAAVRRNLMGGMGLMVEQITQENHDSLGCDGWEISAHANSAPDHEPIQGHQYSDAEYKRLNESLKRRIGTLNCGHVAFPIIMGVNSPQYTLEQLTGFQEENAKGVTYEGRQMTGYEATQYQNRIERNIRTQERRVLMDEAAGDEEQLLTDRVKLTRLNQEYNRYNKAMGFKSRAERIEVIGWGRSQASKASAQAKAYAKEQERAILIEKIRTAGNLAKAAQIHLSPTAIDVDSLVFDDAHINDQRGHGVTIEQAKQWIKDAKISITVWGGRYERYIGKDGAVYIDLEQNSIRTAFGKEEFVGDLSALVEEMEKNGLLG